VWPSPPARGRLVAAEAEKYITGNNRRKEGVNAGNGKKNPRKENEQLPKPHTSDHLLYGKVESPLGAMGESRHNSREIRPFNTHP